MDIEVVRDHYLTLPFVEESFPFDETTLVMKVGSKMFGYLPLEYSEPYLVLKCEPEKSEWLRMQHDYIEPAYHMNKRHWIGIFLSRGVDSSLIKELIEHSYALVYAKLSRKERATLTAQTPL